MAAAQGKTYNDSGRLIISNLVCSRTVWFLANSEWPWPCTDKREAYTSGGRTKTPDGDLSCSF